MKKRGIGAIPIVLIIYLFIFIFYLGVYNYNFWLTGKVIQNISLEKDKYFNGEKLKGNLTIELKKNSFYDLIPSNATFEIWVDGKNIKNYTFAEIVNLSYQQKKGNFTFGVFRNVDGLAPAQKGWGYSYCESTNINITQKKERPAEVKGESCRPGEQRVFICPDGINKIIQRCICETIDTTPECSWKPDGIESCINLYDCFGFNNKYKIDLSKLNIPVNDINGDKNVEIKFRIVYRWTTRWNYSNPMCSLAMPCNMTNYASNWSPVCGINNITYPNSCFAICEGMTSISCYHECPCEIPAPKGSVPGASLQGPLGVQLIKTHEVVIDEKKYNVSIELPEIECEWNKVCENNAEWNVTNKAWMVYDSYDRCIAAMCTLNDSFDECIKAKPYNSSGIKILNKCTAQPVSPGIYQFSIYRCDYKISIRILKEAPSIINLLPDNAYLGEEIWDKIRDCPRGYRCVNNECRLSGGGGGSGGGGLPCYPNWTCSNYGDCQPDGKRYRVCIDISNCNVGDIQWWNTTGCYLTSNPSLCLDGLKKPSEQIPCTITCVENWQCGEWSDCENGIQTRECIDVNNCGTEYNKPQTVQTCNLQYQPPTKKEEKKLIEWWKFLIPSLLLLIIIAIIISIVLVRRKQPIALETKITKEVPEELLEYVKNCLKQGASRKEIESKLKAAGWPQDLIDLAFEKAK